MDVPELLRLHDVIVGIMDADGVAVGRIEVVRLTGGIVVHLDVVAAGDGLGVDVGLRHLGDFNASLVDIYMVSEGVGAAIVAIDHEVNDLAPRRPLHVGTLGHGPCYGIAQQGLVAVAVDEHPLLGLDWRLVLSAPHHVMALAVVVLEAERFVLVRGGIVAADAEEDGIFLQAGSAVVDEHRLRLEVLAAVLGQDVVLHMDAERRQVGNLVELAVVALSGMAIELQLSHIAVRPCAAHIADIAEATADIDVGFRANANAGLCADEVEGHSIHEVGAVGTFEEAEQHAVRSLAAGSRSIVNTRNDAGFAQVQSHPLQRIGHGTEVGRGIAIESQWSPGCRA